MFAALSLLLLYAQTRSRKLQQNLALLIVSTYSFLVVANTLAIRADRAPPTSDQLHREAAKRLGVPFDRRSLLRVILDYRASGQEYWPFVSSPVFYDYPLNIEGKLYHPMGGISNTQTVTYNEGGVFGTYLSDRYGLNNPDTIWERAVLDVAVVGDSFAHGACLQQGDNAVDLLRQTFPATVNLGSGGSGPLKELAVLREVLALRPIKLAIWLYWVNDLDDLYFEKATSILVRYLDASFSQDIFSQQQGIDSAIKEHVDQTIKERRSRDWSPGFLTLDNVRDRVLTLVHNPQKPLGWRQLPPEAQRVRDTFREVLSNARTTVEKQGGTLVFAHLPSHEELVRAPSSLALERILSDREQTLAVVGTLGIPAIDLGAYFRTNGGDPISLFPLGLPTHYNEKGYKVLADALTSYIRDQNLLPQASK